MNVQTIECRCGGVSVELRGKPIASVACHCDDCQAGARMLEALPNAIPVTDAAGGTPYVHYRKDRVRCTRGASLLQRYKLNPKSPTNRAVASCCNTPMFIDFDRGPFWVAVYRGRLGASAPPLEMRVSTKFNPPGLAIPDDVPSYTTFPISLVARIIGARIAMAFGPLT